MNAPRIDACSLLTSGDIQAVQGEPIQETKPSSPADGSFAISQCYIAVATASNSVVLTVTQPAAGSGARNPKDYWQETFHPSPKEAEKEEEGEKKSPPMKIEGVGDEAFWSGNAVGGALYAIKGDSFIRISVGGAGDTNAKLEKSKKLAEIVLKRL